VIVFSCTNCPSTDQSSSTEEERRKKRQPMTIGSPGRGGGASLAGTPPVLALMLLLFCTSRPNIGQSGEQSTSSSCCRASANHNHMKMGPYLFLALFFPLPPIPTFHLAQNCCSASCVVLALAGLLRAPPHIMLGLSLPEHSQPWHLTCQMARKSRAASPPRLLPLGSRPRLSRSPIS
jgi:hypothetical protein